MEQFRHAEEYRREEFQNVAFSKDSRGRDWYDTQSSFASESETDKVSFIEATGVVIAVEADATKMFPSAGTGIIEVPKGRAERKDGVPYKIDVQGLTIVPHEEMQKAINLQEAIVGAEQRITDLRRAVDEVEYSLIEDTTPSYRELLGRWVRYRKQLNDFDTTSGATIPSAPSEK